MIIHDVRKRDKGTLRDFTDTQARAADERLRLSASVNSFFDVRRGVASSPLSPWQDAAARSAPGRALRLSLLETDIGKKRNGVKATEIRPPGHLLLVSILVLVGLSTVVIGWGAWIGTKTEMASIQKGLETTGSQAARMREAVSTGHLEEALALSGELSSNLRGFARWLRMRLLLPDVSSHLTDTQMPALVLDSVTHILQAMDAYRQAYEGIRSPKGRFDMLATYDAFADGSAELARAYELLTLLPRSGMPPSLQASLDHIREPMGEILRFSDGILKDRAAILDLLGTRYPRRYAFLLQNADEMRPTGGFIGSVAFVDVNDGHTGQIAFTDVYELDWKSGEATPPPELREVTDVYGLRDSNYRPDFRHSGAEALKFFDKQEVATVDAVIAINHRLIVKLLRVIGPINVPSLNEHLTADNFSLLLSMVIESKRNPDKPKDIMKEVIAAVSEQMEAHPWHFLPTLLDEARLGNIAAYSPHVNIQSLFERWKLSGTMRQPDPHQDYILVTESNVGGNKSDRYISQQASHLTEISSDGTLTDTLRLTRQHAFSQSDEAAIRSLGRAIGLGDVSDGLMATLGRGLNKSSIRIYVPLGSRVASVQGVPSDVLETSVEDAKTVFSFPMNTGSGTLANVEIRYTLPFAMDPKGSGTYELLLDKQIGQKPVPVEKRLTLPFSVRFDLQTEQRKEHARQLVLDRSQTFTVSWE